MPSSEIPRGRFAQGKDCGRYLLYPLDVALDELLHIGGNCLLDWLEIKLKEEGDEQGRIGINLEIGPSSGVEKRKQEG